MKKTAIVIGATGLIGSKLIEQLSQADFIEKVISITRRPKSYSDNKVENHVVDFSRLEDFSSLFKGDILFSCLGTTIKQAGGIEAQRIVDLNYQFQAARLAADNNVEHYLLVSSSGANTNSSNGYLKMKGELETQIRALPYKRISIFQPSLLIGKRDNLRIMEKLCAFLLPTICMLPGLNRYRPIAGEQVATKMVNVSHQQTTSIELYVLDEIFAD